MQNSALRFYTIVLMIGASAWGGTFAGAESRQSVRQYDMSVKGLTCPFCVAASSKALRKITGVNEIEVDLKTGLISVCTQGETVLRPEQMKKLFRKKGFTFQSMTEIDGCLLTTPRATSDTTDPASIKPAMQIGTTRQPLETGSPASEKTGQSYGSSHSGETTYGSSYGSGDHHEGDGHDHSGEGDVLNDETLRKLENKTGPSNISDKP